MPADVELGGILLRIAGTIRKPQPMLQALGLLVVGRAQKAFMDQKRGAFNWQARATPNILGILADLNRDATPPARRFQPRPAGIDTGNLMQSLTPGGVGTVKPVANDAIDVGTVAPGADLIQYGGESFQPVTEKTKANLRAWLKRKNDPELSKFLKFLLRKDVDGFNKDVPARPFLIVTDQDAEDMKAAILRYFVVGAAA